MSDTKISGVKINIEKGNRKLAEQLEEAIATLQSGLGLSNTSNPQTGVVQNLNQGERCHKCNRNCRTKAVLCIYGHLFVLSKKFKNNNIVKALEANDKQDITLAESLLQEENVLNCHACDLSIINKVDCCSICLMKFHSTCLNTTNHTCFACLGLKDQSDIVQPVITQDQQTTAKTIDAERLSVGNIIDCSPTKHTEKNAENLTTSNTLSNTNNSTAQDQNETSANSEFQKLKMKETSTTRTETAEKKDEQFEAEGDCY
ncbi:Hypothetical predicted protein [Mytilus galloprovincialis]|uniref:Phorbol-ester/DAG-type domain-containing protein n=1 Tax=Mytilus galloprovincialis TaxID=29158 RepID=A0A8B6FSH9_MYTGA|nr:Hypothetical predicted protein [Mytilus galloprovincialis]